MLKIINENKGHIRDKTIQNSTNYKGQDYSQFCTVHYKIKCVYGNIHKVRTRAKGEGGHGKVVAEREVE